MGDSINKMSDKRIELIDEIEKWTPKVSADPTFLELAFFKIFVKFENFITDTIFVYATESAVNVNKVKLRVKFDDREHFKNITGLQYLDTGIKTKKLVDQIFTSENSFSFFFNSSDSKFFEDMKLLRNYIAHESEESKKKYINKTLCEVGGGFIEPNDFLKSKKTANSDSIYTKFINMVLTYSESIDYN